MKQEVEREGTFEYQFETITVNGKKYDKELYLEPFIQTLKPNKPFVESLKISRTQGKGLYSMIFKREQFTLRAYYLRNRFAELCSAMRPVRQKSYPNEEQISKAQIEKQLKKQLLMLQSLARRQIDAFKFIFGREEEEQVKLQSQDKPKLKKEEKIKQKTATQIIQHIVYFHTFSQLKYPMPCQEDAINSENDSSSDQIGSTPSISANDFYILTRYYPHGTLKEYLRKLKQRGEWLTEHEILFIAKRLLATIRFFDNNIVHRNIKLSNIVLDDSFNPLLSDFRLALISKDNSEVEMRLRQKAQYPMGKTHKRKEKVGTRAYMQRYLLGIEEPMQPKKTKAQPKQLENQSDVERQVWVHYSYRNDLWSIGVVIYSLYYRQQPFFKTENLQLPKKNQGQNFSLKVERLLFSLLGPPSSEEHLTFQRLSQQYLETLLPTAEQEKVRKSLAEKNNTYRAQVKRVFHHENLGYCIVLTNRRTFLLLYTQYLIIEFDQSLFEDASQDTTAFKTKEQERRVKARELITQEYIQFMLDWRKDFSIDDYAGDATKIQHAFVGRANSLVIKLSNSVINIVFAAEQKGSRNFNRCVTFRRNRLKPQEVTFEDLQLSIFHRYESNSQALKDAKARQYIIFAGYMLNVLFERQRLK